MLAWARAMLDVHRGRRAAVATIRPLVQQSRRRLDGIPDQAWFDPYMVGFIVMLITLVATRQCRALGSHFLGLIQCEAWAEITGLEADLVGEEVLLLSSDRNKSFEQGCRNAVFFSEALYDRANWIGDYGHRASNASLGMAESDAAINLPAQVREYELYISLLWVDYFDGPMAALDATRTRL